MTLISHIVSVEGAVGPCGGPWRHLGGRVGRLYERAGGRNFRIVRADVLPGLLGRGVGQGVVAERPGSRVVAESRPLLPG